MNNLLLTQAASHVALKKALIALTAISVVLFYYYSDPADSGIGMTCWIKSITGWQCWGCGGQRAFHQLLHGNFGEALQFNALVFPVVILLSYTLMAELFYPRPSYIFLRKRNIQIATLFFVISFAILRNLI